MKRLRKDKLLVQIYENRSLMGAGAAEEVSKKINELLTKKEFINIVFAAAPSQNEFLAALKEKDIDWNRINAFHMDEYVGLNKNAPQLFGNYLKNNLFADVPFQGIFYIDGIAPDVDRECKRYAHLLEQYPTDIVLLGIGENTHIAFNDPHVAFFNDQEMVKVVELDERNRLQQVDPADPSCFEFINEVPTHAITLTVPALFKAKYAYAIAPGKRKSEAISHTLHEQIQEKYPSTILREHDNAVLYIDEDSAAEI